MKVLELFAHYSKQKAGDYQLIHLYKAFKTEVVHCRYIFHQTNSLFQSFTNVTKKPDLSVLSTGFIYSL